MESEADYYTREYNPRLAVPNFLEIFQRWGRQSAETRQASPKASLDLAFGSAPGERLDLFPAGDPASPLLVFIHGGYWRALDKADFSWVAPPFVARGVSVAVLNYTLAPKASLEDIVREVLRALAWLWRNAPALGFDRNRIVVSGHSAGGHLTAMSMCTQWPRWEPDLPENLVKAGLAMSGIFDLRPIAKAPFFNVDLKLDEALATRLSPALMQPATQAPILTAVGGDETREFHRRNALIRENWTNAFAGDIPMPGRNHMTLVDALADPQHPLFAAALGLCRKV